MLGKHAAFNFRPVFAGRTPLVMLITPRFPECHTQSPNHWLSCTLSKLHSLPSLSRSLTSGTMS